MRVPVLSVVAVCLAGAGALVSLVLGFLILGEDLSGVVPTRWLVIFAASSAATFVLVLTAVATARRALGLHGWRSAPDARFSWGTILSAVVAAALGAASGLSDGVPSYLILASILAVYVTLVRWTWWTWRGFR